jgi:signal recognition particle GTPase
MQLTPHQNTIFQQLQQLQQFVQSTDEQVFILRGYAGTGKTTLIGFLLKWLSDSNSKCSPVILASTGRAARILKQKTKMEAHTIHSHSLSME